MIQHGPVSRREFLQQGAAGLASLSALAAEPSDFAETDFADPRPAMVPDKLVVLTFDDAVKSHRTFVAPLLKELGFGATFFVSHAWMNDPENFMTWKEIAELHAMGFEIGNHTWTHDDFSVPRNAARLAGELALVEFELSQVGVPRPISFAHPGNDFGPESVKALMDLRYQLARRGINPEVEYGKVEVGAAFDPTKHHPLLIPTTGDAYPNWTLEHFQRVVATARGGRVAVLQFHGVPDRAHPWVHTPPEKFRDYMALLNAQGYRAIALRDLKPYIDSAPPDDPLLHYRLPKHKIGCLPLPTEVEATRADLRYWMENMLRYHRYTLAEAEAVTGFSEARVQKQANDLGLNVTNLPAPEKTDRVRVLPYPGGRHPRLGFLEGAIDPMRGTKASIFLPWDPTAYVVVDLPEAIFSNLGLIFLAHTHIPTLWNEQNAVVENVDWTRGEDGSLSFKRKLPDFAFTLGASIRPAERHVEMDVWLQNFSAQPLTGLRTQVCAMLKGAPGFNRQSNDNKIFREPVAATRSESGGRYILTAWERCGRAWGNPSVPCMHSDPVLADCAPAQTVRTRGRLWFYEGGDVEREIERGKALVGAA